MNPRLSRILPRAHFNDLIYGVHVYLVNACLRPQQLTPLLSEVLTIEYLPFTDGTYYGEVNFGDTLT